MGYKRRYTTTGEAAVASYDQEDIAEGTGTVIFDGFSSKIGTSTTLQYGLTRGSDLYSQTEETSVTLTDTGSGIRGPDLDFDLSPFNLPRTAKGVGYANFSWDLSQGAGSWTAGGGAYAEVRVRKWDGTTETDLVVASGARTQTTYPRTELLKFTVPETHFKQGETLRVTCAIVSDRVAVAGFITTIAHDPKARSGAVINPFTSNDASTTTLKIHIPFKLDL